MTYDLTQFATDAGALAEEWTDAEKALGFLCGQFELGKLNTILRDLFADIKAVHDLDDFLNGLQIVPDPANPGKYFMNVDLNEIEDSVDSTFSLAMFSEDVVNVGGGFELFKDKTGTDLNFRTITKSGNITVTQQANTLTIGYDETALRALITANLNAIQSNDADIADLQSQIDDNDDDIAALVQSDQNLQNQISANDNDISVIQTIMVTGANNVGAGQDIFRDKTGNDLNFRGVTGSGDVSVTTSGDNIVVDFTETHSQFLVDAVAKTLTHINENGDQTVADLNALLPEVYVDGATLSADVLTLTDNDTGTPDIVVNFANLRGSFTSSAGVYTYDSGNGTTYNIDTNAAALPFDDSGLSFTATNVQAAIAALDSAIGNISQGEFNTASNVGTGEGVYQSKVGADLRFKTLKVTGGATINSSTDDVTITAGQLDHITNLTTTGAKIYQGTQALAGDVTRARLRTLTAGDNIEVTENTSTIHFSVDEAGMAAALVSHLFSNAAFKQAFYQLFAAGFQDDGNDNLQVSHGANAAGDPQFTACP